MPSGYAKRDVAKLKHEVRRQIVYPALLTFFRIVKETFTLYKCQNFSSKFMILLVHANSKSEANLMF